MTVIANAISRSPSAVRLAVPPPLPAGKDPGALSFLDETDDDMRRLTADIDRVLSGRPGLRLVTGAGAANDDPFAAGTDFEWRGADGDGHTHSDPSERAAGWLERSRREQRFERVRTAIAYIVALSVAVAFATVAGVAVTGGVPWATMQMLVQGLGL